MRVATILRLLIILAAGASLGACAETQLVSHAVKELQPAPPATGTGVYKIGNPYQIDGVWYYPAVDYGYRESGIASWYGTEFHGKRTANGELFDMNTLTAAHRTLPLPSIVRVTNLENGRSLKLRVNDRGPFARGRIIDISRRGAQLLGFYAKGTARVRVEIEPAESRQAALLAQRGMAPTDAPRVEAAPRVAVASESLPLLPGTDAAPAPAADDAAPAATPATGAAPALTPLVAVAPVEPTGIFIQAGAFAEYGNARRLSARLSSLGATRITQVDLGDRGLFRVRIGPIVNVEDADRVLGAVIGAGYPNARIVVE